MSGRGGAVSPAGKGRGSLSRKTVIEIRDLNKIYYTKNGEVHALENVSLDVFDEEFVTVVGQSGCGKTTILKIISGLLPKTAGTVRVNSNDVIGPVSDVGMVFQSPVLPKWRNVLDNVMLPVEILGLDEDVYRERAMDLIKLTGLVGFENKFPKELSGGMQQRVSISRALIHNPPLLLMDEPFGALDALTREAMNLELLRIWQESKKTCLLITHSIGEAVFLADRVIVMTPRPGKVDKLINIDLPRPRTAEMRTDRKFIEYVRLIQERIGLVRV
ncbi:MAG: ABC transporter ATP-binding protein [Candidatus Tectomicrobia bacterium]|nr:ABC transporter ATP-binding protein [Candidatus Tectomicrobia bacterium]